MYDGNVLCNVDNVSFLATKKFDLISDLNLQARDIRFSALTTLLVRRARIVLRLQVTAMYSYSDLFNVTASYSL